MNTVQSCAVFGLLVIFLICGFPYAGQSLADEGKETAGVYFEFRTEQDLAFWKITNLDRPGIRDGCLTGTVVAPGLTLESGPISVDAGKYLGLEILMKSNRAGIGYVHWTRKGSEKTFSSGGRTHYVKGDNRFHLVTIDFSSYITIKDWKGIITSLTLDVIKRANAEVSIKSIRFVPKVSVLPNARFTAFDEHDKLIGWKTGVESGEVSMEVEHGQADTGGQLRCVAKKPQSLGYFMVRLAGALAGQTFTAKGSCKTDKDASPFLGVRFIDINGNEFNRITFDSSKQQKSADWKTASLDFSIPHEAADTLLCYGVSGDSGSAAWKDVELAKGTPITAKSHFQARDKPRQTDWPVGTDLAQKIDCTIAVQNGAPRMLINGKVVPPYSYGAPVKKLYGPQSDLRLIERVAEQDIHVHMLYEAYYAGSHLDYGGAWAPEWWIGPGKYDFSLIDADIRETLAKDPKGLIVLKPGITPPDWWLKAHPEELTKYVDGSKEYFQSFASTLWRKEMGEALRNLIRHVQESDYAQRIIGYLPGTGISFEWQYWGAHLFTWGKQEKMADYSEPMIAYFRDWLRRKYDGDVEKLRAAWHDDAVTFETANIPGKEKRYANEIFCFRDPKVAQDVMDYLMCLADCTADAITYFCKIFKDETDGRALTGVYYGYIMYYSNFAMLHSGHLALSKVIESPYVDFFTGASPYGQLRVPGGPAAFISPVDSIQLHGKLVLNEEDQRTHLTDPSGRAFVGITDMRDTVQTMRRNTMLNITKNVGVRWVELLPGWFDDPVILDTMCHLKTIYDAYYNHPNKLRSEIAVFVDEKSMFYFRYSPDEILGHLLRGQLLALGRMGAPYDTYLLSDLKEEKFPDYKLYIFLNAFALNDADREIITRKLKRDGKTLVWINAAGVFNGQEMSPRYMKDLTGLPVTYDMIGHAQVIRITNDSHPITRGMAGRLIGEANPQGPLFYVSVSGDDVLGKIKGTDKAGLVARDMGTWKSVYVATVGLPPWLLRNIAKYAGVHVYCESNDAVYTDGNIIAIHAQSDGKKRIKLRSKRNVYDLFRKTYVAKNVDTFDVDMSTGTTEAFRLDEAK